MKKKGVNQPVLFGGVILVLVGLVLVSGFVPLSSLSPNSCTYCVSYQAIPDGLNTVVFEVSATGPYVGSLIYQYNFGDGNVFSGVGASESPHTYALCGEYESTVTVTDQDGHSGSLQQTVALASNCSQPITLIWQNSPSTPVKLEFSSSVTIPVNSNFQSGFQIVFNPSVGAQQNCGSTYFIQSGGQISSATCNFNIQSGGSLFAVYPNPNFGERVSNVLSVQQSCSENGVLQINGPGSVNLNGSPLSNGATFNEGCNLTFPLTAVPNSGSNFQSWSVTSPGSLLSSVNSASNTLQTGLTSGSFTLTVNFSPIVTTSSTSRTTITTGSSCTESGSFNFPSGDGILVNGASATNAKSVTYACGSQISVSATAGSGQAFSYWAVGGSASATSPYSSSTTINVGTSNGGNFGVTAEFTTTSSSTQSFTTVTITTTQSATTVTITPTTRTTTITSTKSGTTFTTVSTQTLSGTTYTQSGTVVTVTVTSTQGNPTGSSSFEEILGIVFLAVGLILIIWSRKL